LGQVFRGYKLITDDSDSFCAFIRGDVEKIISYKPEFIKIINNELLSLLDDEWATHPTKGVCYVFKKQWFETEHQQAVRTSREKQLRYRGEVDFKAL